MVMIMNIKIFLTGGTIDGVDYDSLEKAPKNHQSLIPHFLKQAKVTAQYEIEELMIKDSRFITSEDREIISKKCKECEQNQIIITHGTFTLSETAKFLGMQNLGKTIVIVGSMVMGNQKDSDALFNLGAAITAVQILPSGIYISMQGKIFRWDNVKKNKDLFEEERSFQLRLCRREDIPIVTQIEEICFSGESVLSIIAMSQYFELFKSTFVVAEENEKVIGFGIAGQEQGNPKRAWVLDVCVLPEHQKKGVGKCIGQWLIQELQRQGYEYVRATVSPKNIPSQKGLIKYGFKILQEVPDYFGHGEDRLIVERTIISDKS